MRRLRVATIGAGYFARFHHEAWARLHDVEFVAICDSDLEKARAAAARHDVPTAFADARVMCDALDIDLLDIATPPASHLALVSLAAERGIAAICQKAFCRDLGEAREAAAIAEEAGILLVVHENFRFQPWHRAIRAQIEAGDVGHVYQAHFRMRPGDGRGPRAYLDRQPYFQNMERFLVHETGIHFVDTFRFLFGEIVSVSARLTRLNPAIAGEDSGFVLFDFASGTRAILDANRLLDHPADNRRLTMGEMLVEGEAGTLRLDGYGRLFRRAFGENEEGEIAYHWENRGFAGDSVFLLQRHVVDHILEGAPVVNTARDYLVNLAVEEAIYRSSSRGGQTIGLP